MYTKFSTRLSIKYPPDTEYPITNGNLVADGHRYRRMLGHEEGLPEA